MFFNQSSELEVSSAGTRPSLFIDQTGGGEIVRFNTSNVNRFTIDHLGKTMINC